MKQDPESERANGPEREELQALLQHWSVPAPPPEIEDGLRREFRSRRSRARRAPWVPLAAAATLIVAWQMRSADEPPRSPSPEAPVAAVASAAPSTEAPPRRVEPGRVSGSTRALAAPARRPGPSFSEPKGPEVVVEPDQAALLAELSHKLSGTRHASPGTAIPPMPEVEVPRYVEEGQTAAGEWPFVEESNEIGGR